MHKVQPYRITVIALAGLAAVMYAYPWVRLGMDFEIDLNEGWNGYEQMLAMSGASIYSGAGPLYFNNYPPLSFYLVGALGVLLGDPVLAGRLLSVLAVGVIALCCGAVVRAGGGGRRDGWLAGATCLGLFSAFATDYVGVNDPQMLAHAFLCAGFALYVRGPANPARLALVAALFAVGLLIKHNVLALPLVITVHVLWRLPNRERLAYAGVGLGLAGLASLIIHLLFGPEFFRQLLASRVYDVTRGFLLVMEILSRLQAPLAVVGLYLIMAGRGRVEGLVAAYLVVGLLIGIGFSGGAGIDINVFFDVMIGLAVGTGLAAAWMGRRAGMPASAAAVVALVANAGIILFSPQALGRFAVDALGEMEERQRLFREDVAYLRSIPGPAICESHLLCLRAGKPMLMDPFGVLQATLTGRLPSDRFTGMLKRREIAVLQISSTREHPVDEAPGMQVMPQRFVNFSDDVFDELARSYRIGRVGLSGRFHLPRSD